MIEFNRYNMASIVAFFVDFLSLIVLIETGVYLLSAVAIACILGGITKYVLCIKYVFNKRKLDNPLKEFILFSLIVLIGIFFNQVFMIFFVNILMIYYIVGKILTTSLVYTGTYVLTKKVLFS